MRMRAVTAVLAGLFLSASPAVTMSLLQVFHLQRLALSAAVTASFYGFYLAGLVVAVLPMVALGGRIGAPRLFILSIAALAASVLLLSLPFGLIPLLGLRFLQGIVMAGLLASSYALLLRLFGERRLPLALACGFAAMALGFTLLPVLAGLGMSLGGFGVILPVLLLAAAVLGLAMKALPACDVVPQPFDVVGVLLAVLCLGLLLASMNLSTVRPILAVVLLLFGLVVLGLWLWQQWRREAPLLPLDLLARPAVGWAVPAAIFCSLATAGSNLALMSHLPASAAADPGRVGAILAGGSVLGAALALILGWRFRRGPWHLAAVFGAALIACALAVAAWMPSEATWIGAVLSTALGRGLFDVGNGVRILGAAPRERSLAAAGLIVLSSALGNVLGPYVTIVLPLLLFDSSAVTESLPIWLGITAVAALLATLLSLAGARTLSREA